MITEDYVGFETAKLLKEKGFNLECSPFYSEQDRNEWNRNNNYNLPNHDYDANIPFDSEILNVIAPHVSLQMAMKWLREMHAIIVVIFPIRTVKGELAYNTSIYNTHAEHKKLMNKDYQSYEQACEAAIKYCLTELI